MWTAIRNWLTPPVFEDPDKTRSARLLNTILLLLAFAAFFFVLLVFILAPSEEGRATLDPFTLIIGFVVVSSSSGLLVLTRRGQVRLASFIITTIIFLAGTANIYQGGNVSSSNTATLFIVVALAGVLLGGRWAVVFMIFSSLAVGFLGYLQVQNLLPPPFTPSIPIETALYIFIIILAGLLLRSTMNSLNNALTQVGESNFQLRSLSASLEERVTARTLDITLAAEIGRRLAQRRETDQLLNDTVNLIQSNFNLYHVQVYLTNTNGNSLILRAATGGAGTELIQRHHHLTVGPGSINGIVALEKRPLVIPNTLEHPLFRPNALLPETRCEMAVPLLVRDQLIGTLNLQGSQANELTAENLPAFETLAGQIAIALDNARLFTQIRHSQALLEEQARRLTRESWHDYLNAIDREERVGYTYSLQETEPKLSDALQTVSDSLFATQIKILDEPVGTIQIEHAPDQIWNSENAQIVQAVADQVAQQIENLRLLDEAEKFRLEAEEANRRLIREGWEAYQETAGIPGFVYDNNQVRIMEAQEPEETADLTHPLQIRGETVGFLNLAGLSTRAPDNSRLVTTVADVLSTHIENLRLSQTTQTALAKTEIQARRLALLNEMSTHLHSATGWEELLKILLSQAPTILNADSAGLALLLPDNDYFELYLLVNNELTNAPPPFDRQIPLAGTSVGTAVLERRIQIIDDLSQSKNWDFIPGAGPGFHSAIQAPLILGERVLGALAITSRKQTHAFTETEAALMQQIAAVVATTIENYRLLEQTTKRANRESLINSINQRIQSATSVTTALEIATREIGQQLKARRAVVEIGSTLTNGQTDYDKHTS
jgi:GAF domain-containing protein